MANSAETPMRLLVLGASGRIGRAIVDQAAQRGHKVTAFVRSPEKLGAVPAGTVIHQGDPRSVDALAAALPSHQAVLSALGPAGLGPSTILRDAAQATVAAMEGAGVRRLIVVSAAMLFTDAGIVAALLRLTLLRNVAEDSAAMERAVRASALEWTIARPPRLTNGPLTGRWLAADDHMPPGALFSTSRADVAHFLLDEVERPEHVRRVVGVSSPKAPK
jgi:putative NADH-flavin reductase